MTPALGREAGRLRRAFTRAAWIAFAAAQAGAGYVACGGGATGGSTSDQGGQQPTASASQTGPGGGGASTTGDPAGSGGGNDKCAPRPFTVKDAGDDCGVFLHLPCGLPKSATPEPECYLAVSDCPNVCGMLAFNCHTVNDNCVDGALVDADKNKPVDVDCIDLRERRRPRARGLRAAAAASAPARTSARSSRLAAELEAASVFAFDRLAEELTRAGAPPRLIGEARRAARDERRHARRTWTVARALGGAPVRSRRAGEASRALEAVALENAVEGCVRETFGALVASWQGAHAADASIARLSRGLAADETRHAALAWGVGRWCWTRLAPAARRRIGAACRDAIDGLRTAPQPNDDVARAAGLPSIAERRALVDALDATLWRDLARGGRRGLGRS